MRGFLQGAEKYKKPSQTIVRPFSSLCVKLAEVTYYRCTGVARYDDFATVRSGVGLGDAHPNGNMLCKFLPSFLSKSE